MTEKMIIGFDDTGRATDDEQTLKQIEKLMTYELSLVDPEGNPLEWKFLYDPEDKSTLLAYIKGDREIRKNNLMADRPPFAIATVKNKKVVRFEFYQGHDYLKLVWDMRSKDLQGANLKPNYRESPL